MWKLDVDNDPKLARQLERRMRDWVLSRSQKMDSDALRTKGAEPFVTVSRAVGSGGGRLARALGEKIKWSVLDKELLHLMADNDQVREQLYDAMDERDLNFFEEMVRAATAGRYARNDYFRRLSETILSVACQGNAIFLGRAADLILPKGLGLRIRVVASRETCVKSFSERHQLSVEAAKKKIGEIEEQRTEFTENHFHVKDGEPERYDMTINLDRWTSEEAIELILSGMRLRRMLNRK